MYSYVLAAPFLEIASGILEFLKLAFLEIGEGRIGFLIWPNRVKKNHHPLSTVFH